MSGKPAEKDRELERRLDRWFLGGFLAGTANFALWMWIWGTAV